MYGFYWNDLNYGTGERDTIYSVIAIHEVDFSDGFDGAYENSSMGGLLSLMEFDNHKCNNQRHRRYSLN